MTYAAQTPIIVVVQPHQNSGATTNMNDTKMTDKQLITTLIALLERNADGSPAYAFDGTLVKIAGLAPKTKDKGVK